MIFAEKLTELMDRRGMSQARLSQLTGIGKSSLSQYLAGKNEPLEDRRKEIAKALGVEEDYFLKPKFAVESQRSPCVNVPVQVAAKLMGKSRSFVEKGLQDGIFPWGYAVKLSSWSYFISSHKFTEYTGIQVFLPEKEQTS